MKSGATESSYFYLAEHYKIPDNVFVSHLPEEIKKSNHDYKILWAQHAYDQPFFLNFDHHILHHIVSPSQWNKEQFMKYHNVPEHKITVIPTGIAEMFTYSNQKTKTMIFTSIPYKGLEVLAKIIPMIHQVHPDTKFKIFSSMSLYGPSNDPFLQVYDHLKTLKNVEYSPAVDREELVKHYQEAAFFIHPNIWEETFCLSMAEAMKCGAYPIITDIGALAEVAGEKNASVVPIEGENTSKGWKVTDNFLINFANACCMALDYYDKEQKYYHEVSKIISDYVSERYNWKRVSEMWKNTIETLTGSTTSSVSFRPQTMDDWIYNEVYVENTYQVDAFDEHDVVIDIGGHAGYFSKLCMDKGCKNVFAYEAEPDNYSTLLSNLSNYKHFAAYNLAVWKTSNETLEFYTLPRKANTGLNSFYKTHYATEEHFVPIQVETISLDDILFKFEKVKLLKLDVEGSEFEILMNSTLLHKVEKIVGEYHNGMTPYHINMLLDHLKSNGFEIDKVIPNPDTDNLQGTFFANQLCSGTFFASNQTQKSNNKIFGL